MNKLHDLKSPHTGKPITYVKRDETDIRQTFARVRAELEAQDKKKVRPIREIK